MKADNEYKSDREILLEILKELRKIREKLPDGNKPTAADLGLIDNDDLGKALNISRWTLATLRKEGKLRSSKIGARIFYLISDVVDMIKQNFQRD